MSLINRVFRYTQSPKNSFKATENKTDQSPSINTDALDQANLSQDEIHQTSQHLGEFKEMVAGGKTIKDSLKSLMDKYGETALPILILLAPLQVSSALGKGKNHQKLMEELKNLEDKLSEKDLSKSALNQAKEFISKDYTPEKAKEKLEFLGDHGRLYKPTPIRGFLKDAAHYTGQALWLIGPTIGIAALTKLYNIDSSNSTWLIGNLGFYSTFFLNSARMVFSKKLKLIKPPKTKIYEKPISTEEALKRLEKNKAVKVKICNIDDDHKFNKINNLKDIDI